MRHRSARAIAVGGILAVLVAGGPADAGLRVEWKREAFATVHDPLGPVTRVRNGVWRDTKLIVRLRARRLIAAGGLPEDRAVVSTTTCLRTWTTDAFDRSGSVLFLSWTDGRTLELGLAKQRCRSLRSDTPLPPQAFLFDDELDEASLNAEIEGRTFALSWTTEERDEIETTFSHDEGIGPPFEPEATRTSKRFASVGAIVEGERWWPDCLRASTTVLWPRAATCTLGSVQHIGAEA